MSYCDSFKQFCEQAKNPLVIVSSLFPYEREKMLRFLLELQFPVYLEATSGIREEHSLAPYRVEWLGYQRWWDGVLRLGGVPTVRAWRDLELLEGTVSVHSVSTLPFSGLSWGGVSSSLPTPVKKQVSHPQKKEIDPLFQEFPKAEPSLFRALSTHIPEGSFVYLGNSLPIRQWDFAATYAMRNLKIGANRGLNGIDGQISTFFGMCEEHRSNWAILGDLTALYDFSAFWVLNQLEIRDITVVVVNNGGGKIFDQMFSEKALQNRHTLTFSSFCSMWGLAYELWEGGVRPCCLKLCPTLIELVPSDRETKQFYTASQTI